MMQRQKRYGRTSRNGWGWVYVAGCVGSKRVKVGTTKYLSARIAGLRKDARGKAHCFYALFADNRLLIEHRAHHMLRRFARGHEWFTCSPALAALAVTKAAKNAPVLRA